MIGPIDPRFAYIAIAIPFALLWAALYLWSPHTRKEQLRLSAIFVAVGVIADSFLYFNDYWRPQSIAPLHIGVFSIYPESMLFGGAFAGIAAVIYQVVSKQSSTPAHIERVWQRRAIVLGVFIAVTILLLSAGLNSIYATALGALTVVATIVYVRRDLLVPALASGALSACIMFCFYFIIVHGVANSEEWCRSIWLLYGTPFGARFVGIPLTELVWGFSAGAAIGILHKFIHRIQFTRTAVSRETNKHEK
ncbi:MAG TPA: lycopene cyclase domain-containing protein [Candidatus Paceibacterota bacterium]|nr:lycopene cyclase domain-containing protein [Candidatus Paceibacterota bacterium]